MQKMKANLDTQGFDLKNSVGSKRRTEAADRYCVGDSSKKRPKVVVHTTSTPQCPTIRKEPTRIMDAAQFSTSDKDLRVALLKRRFADTIFKAQQEMKAVKTDNPTPTKQQKAKTVEAAKPKARIELKQQRERDRIAAEPKPRDELNQQRVKDRKAAEPKACDELKQQWERDRIAAEPKARDELNLQREKDRIAAEPKARDELKQQRQRDRKPKACDELKQREKDRRAARIALEKMENTAGIELNVEVQREFDNLVGCSSLLY